MENNLIFRRLRYALNLNDNDLVRLFKLAESNASKNQISTWLKKDIDPVWKALPDFRLAEFLNGLINDRRGKREREQPAPEKKLNNNIIFRKLKIALNLKDEDVLAILLLADFRISKHELSAFFRKPGQNQYRECKDQILRNFIFGLQLKYREEKR